MGSNPCVMHQVSIRIQAAYPILKSRTTMHPAQTAIKKFWFLFKLKYMHNYWDSINDTCYIQPWSAVTWNWCYDFSIKVLHKSDADEGVHSSPSSCPLGNNANAIMWHTLLCYLLGMVSDTWCEYVASVLLSWISQLELAGDWIHGPNLYQLCSIMPLCTMAIQ